MRQTCENTGKDQSKGFLKINQFILMEDNYKQIFNTSFFFFNTFQAHFFRPEEGRLKYQSFPRKEKMN